MTRTIANRISRLWRSRLFHNVIALYGMQICRKIVPLITIPYLGRTLGPEGVGAIAFATSCAGFLILFVEYGFNLSASRDIARNRTSPEKCARIVSGVLGAQLCLFAAAGVGALVASHWMPIFRQNGALLMLAVLYAFGNAFTPVWYLQGIEKLGTTAALDICGKIFGLVCLLAFVHSGKDLVRVLLILAVPPLFSAFYTIRLVYRDLPLRMPSARSIAQTLRDGWQMFLLRSGMNFYTVANSFLLGLVAPVIQVGYYAVAERIYVGLFGLITPIQDALYPRLSVLASKSEADARGLARLGAGLVFATGVLVGLFILIAAPALIHLLMGPKFEPSIPVVRIMAFITPFAGLAVAGSQWLLPLGRERDVNRVIFAGGLLNLIVALLLAPRFAGVGMACSVLIAEAFVGLTILWLTSHTTSFWRGSITPVAEARS